MAVAVFNDFLKSIQTVNVHCAFKLVAERPGGDVLGVIAYCSWVDKGTLERKCCGEKGGCKVCVAKGDGSHVQHGEKDCGNWAAKCDPT